MFRLLKFLGELSTIEAIPKKHITLYFYSNLSPLAHCSLQQLLVIAHQLIHLNSRNSAVEFCTNKYNASKTGTSGFWGTSLLRSFRLSEICESEYCWQPVSGTSLSYHRDCFEIPRSCSMMTN